MALPDPERKSAMNGQDKVRPPSLVKSILLFSALAAFLLLFSMIPQQALADAGGWPTATPTTIFIILPSATPTTYPYPYPAPTSSLLLPFPPTPTYTPVVPAFVSEAAVPEIQARIAAEQAADTRATWLTCFPFALVAILILAAGLYWLRSRARIPA
jgi:hypothetical protein